MATDAYAERVVHRRRPSEYVTPVLGLVLVGLVIVWLVVNAVQAPDQFFRVLFIGITNGAFYALVALGYTLVYGILELINFAHGDVFMLGAMMAAVLIGEFGATESSSFGSVLPAILVSLAVAMLGCGLINVTVERIAYKPLTQRAAAGTSDHRHRHVVHPPERRGMSGRGTAYGARSTRYCRGPSVLDRRRLVHMGPAVRGSLSPCRCCSR